VSLALMKWVGSKRQLLAARPDVFPLPEPGGRALVPCIGGGSVAAFYGERGIPVIASDINPRLVSAHEAARTDVEAVLAYMECDAWAWRTSLGTLPKDEGDAAGRVFFESVRERLDSGDSAEQAASLLFVVRAGFNGLYRENGDGVCNTAYGKPGPTRDLVAASELRAYAKAIAGVELHTEDFAVTCARARPGDVVYLDPPYAGTFTGYARGCDWGERPAMLPGMARPTDRERLAAMLVYLDAIGVRWTLSDADCATTRALFGRWNVESVSRAGTVNCDSEGRAAVAEGLWRNWRPS